MKVLMISLDDSILNIQSEAAARMKSYGTICDELHIVIFGKHEVKEKLSSNVFTYSTNSTIKILSPFAAYKIGKKILSNFGDAPKIITTQDPFETGFVGWLLAKKFKTGLEVQMHGDFYGDNYWKKERLVNQIRYYLGKFILWRADAVRVVSERIKKSVSSFVKGELYEISVCASTEAVGDAYFLKNKFSGAYPIILVVGNLVPVKNYKFLLEVFVEIKKRLPDAKLVIAGDGPLKKSLQLTAHGLRLGDDVFFAGYQKNLADFYSSADIFVHPSLYEGWGRAVIEAAYFGLPIVMTDVGLAGEAIINNESGLIVPVRDATALAEAVIGLVRDDKLRERLKEGAKRAASHSLTKKDFLAKIKESWERGD